MTVYAVALSKGGSTKTTTAAEVAYALAAAGRRVLAIDLDQQGNFTTRMGVSRESEVDAVAAEVLTGDATLAEAAVPAPAVPGAHIIAGTHDLAEVDNLPEVVSVLRDQLPYVTTGGADQGPAGSRVAGEWDDVVIDTPPALAVATLAALAAADVVIAAVACETEAYDQLDRLVAFVGKRVGRLRPGQQVDWIVPTRYDSRRLLDREVVDLLEDKFPNRVTTPVCEAVAARDAYTARQPVSAYAPGSRIAQDYATALAPVIAPSLTTSTHTIGGTP